MPLAITGFDPQSGPVGTRVTLDVTGLPTNQHDLQMIVFFNQTSAGGHVERNGANQVVAEVPNGATTGLIGATQQLYSGEWENAQSPAPFEVTQGAATPTITYVPAEATAGYLVAIRGQNLGGVTQVRLGPAPTVIIPSFQHINNMRIQFMIPASIELKQYRVFLMTANGAMVQSPTFMDVKAEEAMKASAQSSGNA